MYQEDIYYVELKIAIPAGIFVDRNSLRLISQVVGRQFDDRKCQVLQLDSDSMDEKFERIWGLVFAEDGCLLGVLLQKGTDFLSLVTQIQPSTMTWEWVVPSGIEVYPESHTPDLDVRDYVNFIVKHDVC